MLLKVWTFYTQTSGVLFDKCKQWEIDPLKKHALHAGIK